MRRKDLWALFKDSWNAWGPDKAPCLGTALASYTTFSLAPLLVIVIATAALVFGREAVQGKLVAEIGGLKGHPQHHSA
jgi:membrane protein